MKPLTCTRCGHQWFRRKATLPKKCPAPKCGSPYWNRERRLALIRFIENHSKETLRRNRQRKEKGK